MLRIHQFACLQDNFGFLVRDESCGAVACIDSPDANVILVEAEKLNWPIDLILNTHWHPDHTQGNAAIKAATGALVVAPEEATRSSVVDRLVYDGDKVAIGSIEFDVVATPGHTHGHVVYYSPDASVLFAGDTIFPMGCGRLFEGSPEDMRGSLQRISAMRPETSIYSAHEYGIANAAFAELLGREPEVRRRTEELRSLHAAGRWSVPTTLQVELDTNPFLRPHAYRQPGETDLAAFARTRRQRDGFKA